MRRALLILLLGYSTATAADCVVTLDSIYSKSMRDTCAPNFTDPPDTLRLNIIVPSLWTGKTWAYVDSVINVALDSLNAIYERETNIYFDAFISNVQESDWAKLGSSSVFNNALYQLSTICPDSQINFMLPWDATMSGGEAPIIKSDYATAWGFVTGDRVTLWSDFCHEFGHSMGLQHTHSGVDGYDCDDPCRAWPETYDTIPDSVLYLVGDYCPDVPADPQLNASGYPVTALDTVCADSAWDAGTGSFPSTNLMSYGNETIRGSLSDDQATIARAVFQTYYQRFVKGSE